ncbi:hypothetical protein JAAARDRAFT_65254 [Jaapia argillacea MUCL 33604]|uniref:Methyltransferase domain-containing protein n=1 Tax=Jaapia argillacea MUCL 33604 TaxID=933084 RepID=A0A067QI34_9AGAM|nr:hypothetical protein JAAARDRAFT_65254 [Jaapia argillacea MUCL 33604]
MVFASKDKGRTRLQKVAAAKPVPRRSTTPSEQHSDPESSSTTPEKVRTLGVLKRATRRNPSGSFQVHLSDAVPSSPPSANRSPKDKTLFPSLDPIVQGPGHTANDIPRKGSLNDDVFEQRRSFVRREGMVLHPYSARDAPYPQAYNPVLLENDLHSQELYRRLTPKSSPTFHDYEKKPPSNVLDLGCGQGEWVLEAAHTWRSHGTKVTGFDLVDVHANAWEVEKSILDNVFWVQGNFVKYKLPFPDGSFDLVRMANLTLCIPYDRWIFVLSEVRRVLTPGGLLELVDDQIFFPCIQSPHDAPIAHAPSTPPRTSGCDMDSDDDFMDATTDSEDATAPNASPKFKNQRDPYLEWDANAKNAVDMELLFHQTLIKGRSIHPRPHQFLDVALQRVFGKPLVHKSHSLHLALPHPATPTNHRSDVDSEKSTSARNSDSSEKQKGNLATWMTMVEWDQPEKGRKKEKRTSQDSVRSVAALPPSISAKAAGRLGIADISRAGPAYQPPGLILWPSTFIPMTAEELDHSVSKNIHILLGCKVAMEDHLAGIKDEQGRRLVSEDEFSDSFWQYDCFRRKRFNLPADLPDVHFASHRHSDPITLPKTPEFHLTTFSLESPPKKDTVRGTSFPAVAPREETSETTFVRAIRVWEAYKMDEKTVSTRC